ncbi:MAG: polyribonucleotide nucleotidyltransferase [Candidatus Pacebacteria bacterium]|nr:polyribonucleotide nucleotidyltransferase [Candidatus Paceibacterota bacterium]
MSYPSYEKQYHHDVMIGDKTIKFTIGKFSEQVDAAVLAQCGDTVVHTTVALGRPVNLDYFPLSVEFEEKLYSSGIIKGSRWVKREGRPTDDAILRARVIDRTMRPLFPEGIKNEVQIINTVLSYDGENEPDMIALLATGLALQISSIPFDGPVAGARLALANDGATEQFVFNPLKSELKENNLDLIVSASKSSIVMVEAGANEIEESIVVDALIKAQEELSRVCDEIEKIAQEIGKEKATLVEAIDPEEQAFVDQLKSAINQEYGSEIHQVVIKRAHLEDPNLPELVESIVAKKMENAQEGEREITADLVNKLIFQLEKDEARRMILEDGQRPDGRKADEIRQIWTEVDVLPRAHGSAMFKRGSTQALTVVTLADPSLGQTIEDITGERVQHYMHHYNMPPYASGEAGRVGYPKRREIGHGALAERALRPMLPSQEDFPYAIRVVSEIMSSNGSTSQASVCGSTLSLMAAGVPLKRPVSGIAMGLMTDGQGKYVILSDIQGLEDHVGDMDFKVAGSEQGITAIQMDIKLKGIDKDILVKALSQAKNGRMHILQEMLKSINQPRQQISQFAPKVAQLVIPADKIGSVIGSGGSVIKDIIEKTGAEVNVVEDKEKKQGIVNVSSPDQQAIDQALKMIDSLVREVAVGDEFLGKVTRVESYGAFLEYLPGREGLLHVSNMSTDFIRDAHDKVKLDDELTVRIKEIGLDGKVALTALSPEQEAQQKQARFNSGNNGNGGNRYADRNRHHRPSNRPDYHSRKRSID